MGMKYLAFSPEKLLDSYRVAWIGYEIISVLYWKKGDWGIAMKDGLTMVTNWEELGKTVHWKLFKGLLCKKEKLYKLNTQMH